MKLEGLVKETDLELVFQHWQKMEEWVTLTDMHRDDCEYAPYRSEREEYEEDWNESIALERKDLYQQLHQALTTDFTNLQAYKILISGKSSFYISIIIAEAVDGKWLCLTPTIPDQVIKNDELNNGSRIHDIDNTLVSNISEILRLLKPLKMYGYYHGGYNYCYHHQIIRTISPTKEKAFEEALQAASMVTINSATSEYNDDDKLIQFINKCLLDLTYYTGDFWEVGFIYKLARTEDYDWMRVRTFVEFEYNP